MALNKEDFRKDIESLLEITGYGLYDINPIGMSRSVETLDAIQKEVTIDLKSILEIAERMYAKINESDDV